MDVTQTNESWLRLYETLGRLTVAVGRAEWGMFIMLNHLERIMGKPLTENPPSWSQLIKILAKVEHDEFSDRLNELVSLATVVAHNRNFLFHFYWEQAYVDGYWGKRIFPKGRKPPSLVYVQADELLKAADMAIKLADNVIELVRELQSYR